MTNDYLLKEARELVEITDANEDVTRYYDHLPLGSIWENNEPLKRAILNSSGSFDEAVSRIQLALYDHTKSRRDCERAVWWHLQRRWGTDQGLTASDFAPEDQVIRVEGLRYWHDDFRHAATIDRMAKHINLLPYGPVPRILELGAGCGNMARIFKNRCPKAQYVIIDLPDTLVFSMMYLRANFPDASWQFIDEPKGFDTLIGVDTNFVFIPVGHENLLDGQYFDAFINTASMGEMSTLAVNYWMDFALNRIDCKYLFSVNRFLNTISASEREWRQGENAHAFMISPKYEIVDWELGPDFLRCPWQNRHARQLLCFGRKRSDVVEYDERRKDAAIGAMTGSWNNGARAESMTINDPPLNCDFTMSGPLFALWEAYRLSPSPQTKAGLQQYMGYLLGGSDRQFEDEIYLERN